MYANLAQPRGFRISIMLVIAAGFAAFADQGAAQSAPESEAAPAANPAHVDVEGVDLNAGQMPLVVDPSAFGAPTLFPDGEDAEQDAGVRVALDCHEPGDFLTTFGFSNVFRANTYTVSEPRVLKEFAMMLNVAQTGRTLYFYVYERNLSDGKYYRIYGQSRTFASSGLAFYSSPTSIDVDLQADSPGRYYVIGVAWATPAVTFGLNSVTYPVVTTFGRIEGNSGLNAAPPLATPLIMSLNRTGAYKQRICFEPLPGACCDGFACSVVQRTACTGQFSEEGNTCEDVTCPLPERPCCFGESCQILTEYECEDAGGLWNTNGMQSRGADMTGDWDGNGCIDVDDDYTAFAGCLEAGGPITPPSQMCQDRFDFIGSNGTTNGLVDLEDFAGFQSLPIDSNGCPPVGGGNGDWDNNGCIDRDDDFNAFIVNCLNNGGPETPPSALCLNRFDFAPADGLVDLKDYGAFQFLPIDPENCEPVSTCDPNPCRLPRGACCRMDGFCDVNLTEEECTTCNGQWRGPDSNCDSPCPVMGCCESSCQVVAAGGGCPSHCPGLTCAESNCAVPGCPAIGACCGLNGCIDATTETNCQNMEGVFLGVNSRCCEGECELFTGACCLADGSCSDNLSQTDCASSNGVWEGAFTLCSEAERCPQACCFYPSGCLEVTTTDCTNVGGFPQGPLTVCGPACTYPDGACCFENGSCLMTSPTDCPTAAEACFVGPGVPCGTSDCTDANGNDIPDACED